MQEVCARKNESIASQPSFIDRVKKDFSKNMVVYIMVIPVILYYLIFCYAPMYGAIIAFKNFNPIKGIIDSPWIGFKNFQEFFGSYYFVRILKNTLWISLNSIVWGFPAPIIFALLINELRNKFFTRTVQTITYLPHFISLIVICGMIKSFTSDTGIITSLLGVFGVEKISLLQKPGMFVPIYIISDIWQGIGWGSIIYLAALMGINPEVYDAATIDGAGRLKQIWYVSIPGIAPTILIMLILRLGGILNVGFEKIILLYNPITYETADVISTFVYRKGLLEYNWGFSTAVGLFNSLINLTMLVSANWISKKVNETSLW